MQTITLLWSKDPSGFQTEDVANCVIEKI